MRNVPFTKYVRFVNSKYMVAYGLYCYGYYDTLIEALMTRDKMAAENYPEPKYKFIQKTGKSYTIIKRVNGKQYSFGSYVRLSEALKMRDYFESEGWENCLDERLVHSTPSHIRKTDSGKYQIIKQYGNNNNRSRDSFGVFNSKKEAEIEVRKLRRYCWDIDALCDGIDERNNNEAITWLNRNISKY